MGALTTYVTDLLVEYGFVCEDKKEICKYGLENLVISFLEILSILLLAILIGNFLYALILIITLVLMRRYTGGYHAKTKLGCYIILIGIYGIFSMVVKFISTACIVPLGILVLMLLNYMVWKYAPIVNSNKKIDNKEKETYRKFSVTITIGFSALVIVGLLINADSKLVLSVIVGLLTVSLSMVAALLTKRRCIE